MLTQPTRDMHAAAPASEPQVETQRLVIVGGGMAGFGLCDRLVKHPVEGAYDITLFGDEPQLAYDRCLLYTSPSPRDKRQSRMPSSA